MAFDWHIKEKNTSIEWRYFNFKGEKLSGIFSFLAFDLKRANKLCLIADVFENGKAHGGYKLIKLDEAIIKKGNIISKENDSIAWANRSKVRFRGKVSDISWDLTYTRRTDQSLPKLTKRFSLRRHVSWKVAMPSAKVTGTLKIKDRKYKLNAEGYLDGNWGNWFVYDVKWNWLQLSKWDSSKSYINIILGELSNLNSGAIFVIHNGKNIMFSREKNQFHITHRKMDNKYGPAFPREIVISAENENYLLSIVAKVKSMDEIIKRSPLLLPDMYLFEENTACRVKLHDKKTGKLLASHTKGFSEYSKASYKRVKNIIFEITGNKIKRDKSQVDI